MRISNIKDFLGGADNVQALEYIQGQSMLQSGVVSIDGATLDISTYDITANVEYYTATVVITGGRSGQTVTITSFVKDDTNHPDRTLSVIKSDPTNGAFQITIPEDFYVDDDTVIDATNVPVGVIWTYFDDNAGTKLPFRMMLFVRRGVPIV